MYFDVFYAVLLHKEVLPNVHWIQLCNVNSLVSPCTKGNTVQLYKNIFLKCDSERVGPCNRDIMKVHLATNSILLKNAV
jgi:hypothetical protein